MRKVTVLVCLFAVALAACSGVGTTDQSAPQVWWDKPLPNSQFTVEPINLLAHANAPDGVRTFAFSVNGELVETLPSESGTQPLVTVQIVWTPTQPGTYTLSLVAQSMGGQWSEIADVNLIVVEVLPNPVAEIDLPEGIGLAPATAAAAPTVAPTSTTAPPPTDMPFTAVPPTFTPVPDTQRPVITSLNWDPTSPLEDQSVSFSVLAQDNDRVSRIEIYFVREGESAAPIKECTNTSLCEYTRTAGFPWGTYTYYAIAFDPSDNWVSSFTQTVIVQQVIK